MSKRKRVTADDVTRKAQESLKGKQSGSPDTDSQRPEPTSKRRGFLSDVLKPDARGPTNRLVDQVREIDTEHIELSAYNERYQALLDESALGELIESIRAKGQEQPAHVAPIPDTDPPRFELLAGSRRLAAVRALDRPLKVIVRPEAASWSRWDKIEFSRRENEERSRPAPWERAQFIERIAQESGLNNAEIAKEMKYSRSYISQHRTLARITAETARLLHAARDGDGRNALGLLHPRDAGHWMKLAGDKPERIEKVTKAIVSKQPDLGGSKLLKAIVAALPSSAKEKKASPKKPSWTALKHAKVRFDPPSGRQRTGRFEFQFKRGAPHETAVRELIEFLEKHVKTDT